VFIVERDKTEFNKRPPEFQKLLGYRFWVQEKDGAPTRTLGLPKPNPDDFRYYDSLNTLSSELADKLLTLKNATDQTDAAKPLPADGPTVFLAETSDDLDPMRDEVRRYLDQAGVRVFPDIAYSREPNAFKQAMEVDLQKSDLFVQLLSAFPGRKLPGLPKGYTYLQFECAKNANKPIMQWHSRELMLSEVQDADQQALLQGDSVMAVGIEEFKREIVKRAFYTPAKPAPQPIGAFVFVNAERRDRALAREVCKVLNRHGADYALPLSTGTPADIRQDLEYNLLECDGLIIIYGKVTAHWVRNQLRQCYKIIYKRKSPLKSIAVYEGPPEIKEPLDLKFQNMQILNGRHSLSEKILQSFIDNLRSEEYE
jgi:hypothetical protein